MTRPDYRARLSRHHGNRHDDAPEESGRLLATFDRPKGEELRVVLDEYNGRPFLNARIWYDAGGRMKPTKKGITVNRRDLPRFVGVLLDALDEMNGDGGAA